MVLHWRATTAAWLAVAGQTRWGKWDWLLSKSRLESLLPNLVWTHLPNFVWNHLAESRVKSLLPNFVWSGSRPTVFGAVLRTLFGALCPTLSSVAVDAARSADGEIDRSMGLLDEFAASRHGRSWRCWVG